MLSSRDIAWWDGVPDLLRIEDAIGELRAKGDALTALERTKLKSLEMNLACMPKIN